MEERKVSMGKRRRRETSRSKRTLGKRREASWLPAPLIAYKI